MRLFKNTLLVTTALALCIFGCTPIRHAATTPETDALLVAARIVLALALSTGWAVAHDTSSTLQTVPGHGPDAATAVAVLRGLLADGFGEVPSVPAST